MKKIIENARFPRGFESAEFPSCFASVLMLIEGVTTEEQASSLKPPNGECCGSCVKGNGKLGLYRQSVHNLYAVVSGISLIQLDLRSEEHIIPGWGWNANKVLDEYDDYIKFTMGFAGYSYERYNKSADRAAVFAGIKKSIDSDRPVLMNFGPHYDWCVIIGYNDQNWTLYGSDNTGAGENYWRDKPGSYEDGMFMTEHWYEYMTEAVIVTGKTAPTVTYDDVFRRAINILETMKKTGYFKRSADYLRDNTNFEGYDDCKYLELANRINTLIGLPIDQRNIVSCFFKNMAKVEAFKDKAQYFKRIAGINTCQVCWIAWHMVGAFANMPELKTENCAKLLPSPIYRRAIADVIDIVIENDQYVSDCLREMMGMDSCEK